MRLVLASRSPRRAELLRQIGLPFDVRVADVNESPRANETAEDYVTRLATSKAIAAAEKLSHAADLLVLGADTAVVLDGVILGKPCDRREAVDMLCRLSGRWHQVITGIAVARPAECVSVCVTTEVRFRDIEPWEAQSYADTGEGDDKAGAYGIQGIGGIFADCIRGSYSAVVGLPLVETERLLRQMGMNTWRERPSQSERTNG